MPATQAPAVRTRDGLPSSMIVMTISTGTSALPRMSGMRLLHMAVTGVYFVCASG
jgi:hypothetical protein